VLVNCAGVANAAKTVARDKETKEPQILSDAPVRAGDQINLIGTFRCIAHSAFGMVNLDPLDDGERGVIVNTASVAAQDGQIGQVAYSASKGGVLAMALPIARDLMNDGVRVNTILPGRVQDADGGDDAAQGAGGARRAGAVPQAAWAAGGICAARLLHGRESVHERRSRAARRRHPDGGVEGSHPEWRSALIERSGFVNETSSLLEDIAVAAAEAGAAILKIVEGGFEVESKDDQSPVTIADRAAELIILAVSPRPLRECR
jgi:NAD(P)-dependent dehydrogenase (short-subunit alcohol dehydrogenase family)